MKNLTHNFNDFDNQSNNDDDNNSHLLSEVRSRISRVQKDQNTDKDTLNKTSIMSTTLPNYK